MSKLTDEQLVYLSDEMYTPISYKGFVAKKPNFTGKGNLGVSELENMCIKFEEYCHQQVVIKQNCMKHVLELKFDIELNDKNY